MNHHPESVWPRTKKQQQQQQHSSTDAGIAANPGHALPPTTFFLRNERDMNEQKTTHDQNNDYGVQSLNETLEAAFSYKSPDASPSPDSAKKRKIGNSVHPKIAAAAQRIITSEERSSARSFSQAHPVPRPLTPSPTRRHARSESLKSLGRSFTPLRASHSSTPRSGSVKSLRLSDEEGSLIDDSTSQNLHLSSEEEDGPADDTLVDDAQSSIPQLVMPSISMPSRRPFTERGKRIPKLKVMVVGSSGVGKTSLVKSIMQLCEHIVHVDPIVNAEPAPASTASTCDLFETHASTKSYPSWWSEVEQGRGLRRRKSMGESILERNICFIDTPGWTDDQEKADETIHAISQHIEHLLHRNMTIGELSDTDILAALGGGGGFQVDAVIYVFAPTSNQPSLKEVETLRCLSALANIIPVIGKADTCTADDLTEIKQAIRAGLETADVKTFSFQAADAKDALKMSPFAVSSASSDDMDAMDASLLMSSDYILPLAPSDLTRLVDRLFDPDNVQWLRHCAVKKFIQWRREHLKTSFDSHKRELRDLALQRLDCLRLDGPDGVPSSISSVLSSPTGMLMPNLTASNQRASSPTPFRLVPVDSALQYDFSRGIDTQRLDRASAQLPEWAQNLKIALEIEHQERKQLSMSGHDRNKINSALVKSGHERSAHSKVKAPAQDVDYRDPLGLLALGQRFSMNRWRVLRLAGGCGAVATVFVWAFRNWTTVTEALGFTTPSVQVPGYAVVSARDSSKGPMEFFKAFLTDAKW